MENNATNGFSVQSIDAPVQYRRSQRQVDGGRDGAPATVDGGLMIGLLCLRLI